jgi:hypothetical protein
MRTYLDCYSCFVRQALDAVRLVSGDPAVHKVVVDRVCAELARFSLADSPPAMGQRISHIVKETVGHGDPYHLLKQELNAHALRLLPGLRHRIRASDDPFESAVRVAIAGNNIDCGVRSDVSSADVARAVEYAFTYPLFGGARSMLEAAEAAERILYLGDNAGEIVLDRLLVEQLPCDKLVYAVRGRPVLNDATLPDADVAGLNQLVRVIDSGSDAPGTLLDDCSPAFREEFDKADLVISKGQGNYESLSDVNGRSIYFLLIPKCQIVARHLGYAQGSLVAWRATQETLA